MRGLPVRAAARWLRRRRAPWFVAWRLTERCNLKCKQCGLWRTESDELSRGRAQAYAREMAAQGVLAVSLLGGEVLLRPDLGRLIRILDRAGVMVRVTSNGALVPGRLNDLRPVALLKLSLDGPEAIHDQLRGRGAYRQLMAGLHAARDAGIPLQLNTVLSRALLPRLDSYLTLVGQLGLKVTFQPLERRSGLSDGDMAEIQPDPADLRRAVTRLAALRRKGDGRLANSAGTLDLMKAWPEPLPQRCRAGRRFCRVTADGRIVACDEARFLEQAPTAWTGSFMEGVARLQAVGPCPGCWRNNTLEINRALGGVAEAVGAVRRLMGG